MDPEAEVVSVWRITLAEELVPTGTGTFIGGTPGDPHDLGEELMVNMPMKRVVEHEGALQLRDGDLLVSKDVFDAPDVGYARGQWLRFERKITTTPDSKES